MIGDRNSADLRQTLIDLQIAAVGREKCQPDGRGVIEKLERGQRGEGFVDDPRHGGVEPHGCCSQVAHQCPRGDLTGPRSTSLLWFVTQDMRRLDAPKGPVAAVKVMVARLQYTALYPGKIGLWCNGLRGPSIPPLIRRPDDAGSKLRVGRAEMPLPWPRVMVS